MTDTKSNSCRINMEGFCFEESPKACDFYEVDAFYQWPKCRHCIPVARHLRPSCASPKANDAAKLRLAKQLLEAGE